MTTFELSLIGVLCLFVHSINACGYTATPQGLKTLILGQISGSADDDPSTATCPEGSVPVDCYCSAPEKCDGIVVDGQKCIAYNKYRNPSGVQAAAVCLSDTDDRYQIVKKRAYARDPEVSCPCGYSLEACMIQNPWTHEGCRKPVVSDDGDTCKADTTCNKGSGCYIMAVCRADHQQNT